MAEALRHRANRYGQQGHATRRMRVTFAWNNMALAELRDLNRHRTGNRHTPLIQAGFYLPPEIRHADHAALLADQMELTRELMERGSPSYVYSLLLGAQTPFEHGTHADKFIYEAELRTGMGAHFRYAEHLGEALHAFLEPGSRGAGLGRRGHGRARVIRRSKCLQARQYRIAAICWRSHELHRLSMTIRRNFIRAKLPEAL